MVNDASQFAHDRLNEVARQRRRAAEAFPPLSAVRRARLQEEVRRIHEDAGMHPNRDSEIQGGPARWPPVFVWLGVGAAILPFLFIIFLPQTREAGDRTKTPVVASAPIAASTNTFEIPTMPAFEEVPQLAVPATADAGRGGAFAFVRKLSPNLPLPRAETQPPRQRYHSVGEAQSWPPILRDFEVVQVSGRVEIRDADGSVYSGRIAPLTSSPPEGPNWSYEAQGMSRTLGQRVLITGNFTGPRDDLPEVNRGSATFLNCPLSADVMINGTNFLELRAAPFQSPP